MQNKPEVVQNHHQLENVKIFVFHLIKNWQCLEALMQGWMYFFFQILDLLYTLLSKLAKGAIGKTGAASNFYENLQDK